MESRPLGRRATLPRPTRSRLRWLTRVFAIHLVVLAILAGMALVRAHETVPGRRVLVGYRLPTRMLIEALRVGSNGIETDEDRERAGPGAQ